MQRRASAGAYGNSRLLTDGGRYASTAGSPYLDPGSGGPDNDFTNRNTMFMSWNLHLAWMLKQVGGIPAHGDARCR